VRSEAAATGTRVPCAGSRTSGVVVPFARPSHAANQNEHFTVRLSYSLLEEAARPRSRTTRAVIIAPNEIGWKGNNRFSPLLFQPQCFGAPLLRPSAHISAHVQVEKITCSRACWARAPRTFNPLALSRCRSKLCQKMLLRAYGEWMLYATEYSRLNLINMHRRRVYKLAHNYRLLSAIMLNADAPNELDSVCGFEDMKLCIARCVLLCLSGCFVRKTRPDDRPLSCPDSGRSRLQGCWCRL
jgi:hypothetical protein